MEAEKIASIASAVKHLEVRAKLDRNGRHKESVVASSFITVGGDCQSRLLHQSILSIDHPDWCQSQKRKRTARSVPSTTSTYFELDLSAIAILSTKMIHCD